MNKDQTLLQEAYKKVQSPSKWDRWLFNLKHEVHEDGSISVDEDVDLDDKNLDRIPFRFRKVTGDFYCSNNPNLTSLEGAPREVGGDFYCGATKITSLEGAPREVGKGFYCGYNPELASFEGAPREVGGNFDCNYNPELTSLEGAPREVGGNFSCMNTPKLKSLKGLPKAQEYSTDFSEEEIQAELKRQYMEKFSGEAQSVFGDALWDL